MEYHNSFKKFIENSKYFKDMVGFINVTHNICPLKENVFRFMLCDLSKTKYIVLGMDPYSSTYEDNGVTKPIATGRSFEVANIDRWTDKYKQSSLSNIFKALCYYKFNKKYSMEELRILEDSGKISFVSTHQWFNKMEERGVIFLNATLTTLLGKSGVHINIWTSFMNELINYLNCNTNCTWLIWGTSALDRVKDIVDSDRIIYSCHPASRMNNDFIENNCFKKAKNIEWF